MNNDLEGSDRKTVWFNSRFYRVNLLWDNGTLRFRDIHLFNENFPSKFFTEKVTSNECSFFTLPFVDGFIWSTPDKIAGLRFKVTVDGQEIVMEGKDPSVTNPIPRKLHISWPLKSVARTLVIDMDKRQIEMKVEGNDSLRWSMDLINSNTKDLPFKKISLNRID